jgi:predicted transcriptional regulator
MVTVSEAATADDALRFSGYSEIDFTISEDAPTYDAVQKFAAYNIGCLVVTDKAGGYCACVIRLPPFLPADPAFSFL